MDSTFQHFYELFDQLGLPSDDLSIRRFLRQHQPLDEGIALHEAPFWSEQQAAFLKEALKDDSDWAVVVDQLNVALHDHVDPDELPSIDD